MAGLWCVPLSCRVSARSSGVAPLAQSAEHSHGKAGVVGSIPTGGSRSGAVLLGPALDVADSRPTSRWGRPDGRLAGAHAARPGPRVPDGGDGGRSRRRSGPRPGRGDRREAVAAAADPALVCSRASLPSRGDRGELPSHLVIGTLLRCPRSATTPGEPWRGWCRWFELDRGLARGGVAQLVRAHGS